MRIRQHLSNIIAYPLLLIIRAYQLFISPMLGQNCRFYPTCSCYAHQALEQHGPLKGSVLAIKRIVKCQPLHPGGIDHVPAKHNANNKDIVKTEEHKLAQQNINKTVRNSATHDTIEKPTF
jgi:putative membrane protein insertion efficiency factor